ncbi:hypothetical protein [Streptomyces sp. enrichment culture]|uniref:hypothetical protein n=1 Tax=Streptomyces sp. enrichment culture TaxID=1795815 RepID=UPI003F56D0D2
MTGTRRARTAVTRALAAACLALMCLLAASPAAASAICGEEAARYATGLPGGPGIPAEREGDPSAEPEARVVRQPVRGQAGVRQWAQPPMFHVEHSGRREVTGRCETAGPVSSGRAARSVVLRC